MITNEESPLDSTLAGEVGRALLQPPKLKRMSTLFVWRGHGFESRRRREANHTCLM